MIHPIIAKQAMETEGFMSRELCRACAYPAMAWRWQMSAHVLFSIPAQELTTTLMRNVQLVMVGFG